MNRSIGIARESVFKRHECVSSGEGSLHGIFGFSVIEEIINGQGEAPTRIEPESQAGVESESVRKVLCVGQIAFRL